MNQTNYVDSRTPEEREADSKIELTVTTASDMTYTEKRLEEFDSEIKPMIENEVLYRYHILESAQNSADTLNKEVRRFLSTSITQAEQEMLKRVVVKDDLLDDMWGLICNVNGGFVEKEKPEWYEAFLRIREKYRSSLSPTSSEKAEEIVK